MTTPSPAPGTIALISLGCPKNLVNSEEMAALLQEADYAFTEDPAQADAVIINHVVAYSGRGGEQARVDDGE